MNPRPRIQFLKTVLSVFLFLPLCIALRAGAAHAADVNVVWTNLVGVSASGNSLTKTASSAWGNGGAASTFVYSGDVGIQFTAAETNTFRLCGLSDTDVDADYATIDYAIYLVNNATVVVHENGVSRGTFGSYQNGDVFKVNRTGSTVTYLKNNTVFYTSTISSSGNLLADTALYSTNATINNATFTGVSLQAPGASQNLNGTIANQSVTLTWDAAPDYGSAVTEYEVQYGTVASGAFASTFTDDATPGATITGLTNGTPYQFRVVAKNAIGTGAASSSIQRTPNTVTNVAWADLVGVSASGNTITKTAANGWGNGGAASNVKYSGDFALQFNANFTTAHVIAGLSLSNADANYASIGYGILLSNTNVVSVYENGVVKGSFGAYQTSDLFQVERINGNTIQYKKNGTVFYTSGTTVTADLKADASIYYLGSAVVDAKIIGYLPNGPTAPGIIGDANVVPVSGKAVLTWTAPADNGSAITGYDVQYGTVASGAFASTFTDDAIPGATVTGLTNGTAYQFRVVAKNALGSGGPSNVVTATPDIITDIVWTDLVGVSANGNTITKTISGGWGSAGAASVLKYSGDFAIELTATANSYHIVTGLSSANANANYTSIGYGLLLKNNLTLEVYENGVYKGAFGAYQVGDILRVERKGTVIKYKKNGTVLYTSTTASSGELLVDAALYYQNTTVNNVKYIDISALPPAAPDAVNDLLAGGASGQVSLAWTAAETNNSAVTGYDIQYGTVASGAFASTFNDDATPGATITGLANGTAYQFRVIAKSAAGNSQPSNTATTTPSTTADIVWTDRVGVSVNGNSVTKTAAAGWGNGGAASVNHYNGNVAVEFGASATNSNLICGLSSTNASASYDTVHFGILLKNNGTIEVYESGVSKGIYGGYLTTDRFQVERTGTTVKYRKNGTVFYTSAASSSGDVIADAAMYYVNMTVTNAKMIVSVPSVPSAVNNLTALAGDQRVNLTWSAPADNGSPITGYDVQYGTVASGAFGTTAQSGSTPGTLITDLVNGTAYQFRVIAKNAVGSGPVSNTATATPALQTSAATMISPTPSSTLSDVDTTFVWSTGEGVQAYRLRVGTSVGDDDIADSGQTGATVYGVSTIPVNGSPVYVRLSSLINSIWVDQDYVYGTSTTPVIHFSGNGTGHKEYIGANFSQTVDFSLDVEFDVLTSNPVQNGDIIRYDLTRKTGTTNFVGTAVDVFNGQPTTLNFNRNNSLDIQSVEGYYEYSTTDADYRKILFTIPQPPSPTLPFPAEVEYLSVNGVKTVRVFYNMPSPWNLGYIDNNYIVPGTDNACSLTIKPETYSLLPGDTVDITAKTPIALGDSLQWQVIPLENETARAVITKDNVRGTSAVISDIRGSGKMKVRAINPSVPGCQKEVNLKVGCDECTENICSLNAKLKPGGQINAEFGLGRTNRGDPVGEIALNCAAPSTVNATPDALKVYTFGDDTEKLYNGTALRQIVAPDLFANITVLNAYSYEIKYYDLSAKGAKVSGFYTINGGATPLKTWKVENPDASPTVYDRLKITETAGSMVTVSEYIWDGVNSIWTLYEGNNLVQTTSQETTGSGTRTVVETVKDNLNNIASKTATTYKNIDNLSGITEEVIEVVEDPDSEALTTTTEWYEVPQDIGNFGHVKSVTNPDGSWVKYTYDSLGRVSTEISSWLDETISVPAASARAVYYDYAVQDASDSNLAEDVRRPRKVTEKILDQTISETYYVYSKDANGVVTKVEERVATPGAAYGANGNQRTITVYNPQIEHPLISISYPDGRKDTYSYQPGTAVPSFYPAANWFTVSATGTDAREIITHGTTASPNGVANKSTRDIRALNQVGDVVFEATELYDGTTYQPSQAIQRTHDTFGHVTATVKSNGTQSDNTWDCCTLASSTDETGVVIDYTYDGLKRVQTQTKASSPVDIETAYTYDAAGRRLSETVTGTLSLETESVYDTAGRLLNTTDQAGLVTDYDYSTDLLTTTVTRPGGAEEISEQHVDGQAKSVTGTGVVPQYFTYGVNTDGTRWTQVNTGSASSPNYEKTTTDMLGRTVKVERPGYTGTHTTQYFYNTLGQLQKVTTTGQADVLYEYDSLGNQVRSGLDLNANGALNLSSTDRVADTDTVFTFISPSWWQQTTQKVYATDNNSTATTTSTQRSRLTGLGTGGLVEESVAIDIHGNQTVAQTVIDRANKTQTRSVDYPDSDTNAVSVSVNGLLTSDTSKTGVTTTYSYDSLERPLGVTDPRAGTTTTKYNNTTGQVDFVRDAAGNKVSYTYDTAGRKATETNALNDVTRFSYNDRNQVTRTWGDVPYPVEYVYDSYGRVSQMRTWRISAAWTGATWPSGVSGQEDVTTWNYQEATGLLTSKVDDNAKSVAYTYTTAGQLLTRTWARGPVTTYGYDTSTGELLTVNYSDSTPDVTFTYDRLGRIKTVADGLGNRTFSYNTALQPDTESITGLYNASITRNYATSGVIGRPSGLTMGALYTQTYGYDAKGRYNATNWTVNALSGSAAYTYVASSDLLGTLTTASGQSTTYTYETNRNLRTQVNNQFNSTLISQYAYQYDALGRRTSVVNTGSAFAASAFNRFVYNDRSELNESARYLGTDINVLTSPVTAEYRSFVYDPIGNRTNITVAANNGTYSANNLNQYSTENVAGGGTNTFTYDDDGNLTAISGVKNVQYTFDAENRMTVAQPTTPALNDKKMDLVYDYQGRRVQKIVSNWSGVAWVALSTKRFVYDGWNVIEEQTVAQPSRYMVWGLDLSQSPQGAGGVGGLLTTIEGAASNAFLYDGNGNVSQLVDTTTGLISAHYEYDPYGNLIVASGSLAASNPYRFSTKYLHAEYDLYDYGRRLYTPYLGRWLNRDPLEEEGGLNLYSFVGNNSINVWDLLGERKSGSYQVRGTGHHIVSVELWEEFGFPDEAKKVFDDATIPVQTFSEEGKSLQHTMRAHGSKTGYTGHVRDEMVKLIDSKGLAGKKLTVTQYVDLAEEIVENVKNSPNHFIRGYLKNVGNPKELNNWYKSVGAILKQPEGLAITRFSGITKIKIPRVALCRKVPIVKYAFVVGVSYVWYVDYNNARADGYGTTLAGTLATAKAADPGFEMAWDFGYGLGNLINEQFFSGE